MYRFARPSNSIKYHMTTFYRTIIAFSISIVLISCGNDEGPDVSKIDFDIKVQRFEQDFFKMDTNNIPSAYKDLEETYKGFVNDFNINILGLPLPSTGPLDTSLTKGPSDSSADPQTHQVLMAIRQFIRDYAPVKDSADIIFKNFTPWEEEVENGIRHVLYYFPAYKAPKKLITFIGPMDAYYETSMGGHGDVITPDGLAVGLQLHLGSEFSLYKSQVGQSLYPAYISRKFTPETIPVNCIRNIIDDMFPDKSYSKSLIEQMVEKGRRMYLLDKFLPETADTLKIGYTKKQLEGCYENEGLIWNFFLTNSLVYNNDPAIIKNYIGDAPSTQELGAGSPGFIGLFVGWRIVQEYMENFPETKPDDLMALDQRTIFEGSRYKPR